MLYPEIKLAFDLRKYNHLSSRQGIRRVSSDLAALAIETKPRNEGPLVTPFKYDINFQLLTVVCPEFSLEDIRRHFTSADAHQICDLLLDPNKYEGGCMVILWISAPGRANEPESRLTLTVSHITNSQKAQAGNYSGLCTTLTSRDCLNVANHARLFSPESISPFSSADEVRDHPIQISVPKGLDPYEFVLTSVIPLPEVLHKITSGEADSLKSDFLKSAQAVAEIIAPAIIGLTDSGDYIKLGAQAERLMMASTGFSMIGTGSGCGLLNSEYLGSSSVESYSHCQEIICPNCGWSPNSAEIEAVQNGRLVRCPNPQCHYDPVTHTTDPIAPPVVESVFDSTTKQESKKVISAETETVKVSESTNLPWLIYFFLPWLE